MGMIKAIFFDAAGTLFHLPLGVGYHYALVGEEIGLKLDAAQLDRAFVKAWNSMTTKIGGASWSIWCSVKLRRH